MDLPPLLMKVVQIHGAILLAVAYCVLFVRPRSPGIPRLLASIPAITVLSLSPIFVSESTVLSSGMGLTFMWVATFKLLAYSGGRGALSHPGVRSGLQWGALLLLPFFPAKSGREHAKASIGAASLGVLIKLGVWAGLSAVLLAPDGVPLAVRHVCYAVYMWMFVSLCLDAGMPLSGQLLSGMPLQPAMDAPYASTSVREFWGRRYNQIVSATLLETVYKPIVEGRWVTASATAGAVPSGGDAAGTAEVSPPQAAETAGGSSVAVRAGPPAVAKGAAGAGAGPGRPRTPLPLAMAALVASFLVSGIMHEICVAISCGGRPDVNLRMLSFFLAQPLIILAQDAATAALVPKSMRESRAVALVQTGVTLALVLASAELFWGALESCRLDQRGLEEVVGAMQWLAQLGRGAGLVA